MSSTNPDCTQPLDTDSEQPIRSTGGSCKSQETNLESCGENLAKADGGMFAVQINVSEVSTWFWSRSDTPNSISQARPDTNIDVSDWGTPSATYPVAEGLLDQQELALEIVSCDQWSRTSQVHTETCFGKCASNAIAGRSDYGNAYWEISYIRVFSRTVTEPEPLFKLARKAFTTSSSDMDTTTSTLVLAAPGRTFGIFDPSISSTSSSISLETNTEISTTLTVTPTSSPESTTISDTSTPLGFDTGSKYESDTREATLATFDMFDPTTDATSVVTLTSGTLITVTSVSNAEIITTDSTTTIRPTSLAASLHHSATIWNSFLLYIILRTLVML
ncbi:hypothetical protein VNI00_005249 [Paramarasmius palmivorus]|uniref:Uncharacterized protein n=1 Tax=Paramarasmius palmivorus TaxID=297713 RepID=A0AAW0DHF0_9AGAR